MSSTHPTGSPRILIEPTPTAKKRSADDAGLPTLGRDARRRYATPEPPPHPDLRMQGRFSPQVSAFVPVEPMPTRTSQPAPYPTRRSPSPPSLPPREQPLTAFERDLFAAASALPDLRAGLEHCIKSWARRSCASSTLDALEHVVIALAARHGTDDQNLLVQDALDMVRLAESTFGSTVEPTLRHAWLAAMQFGAYEPGAQARRRRAVVADFVKKNAALIGAEQRSIVTKQLLMVASRHEDDLPEMEALFARHGAFGMYRGEFIAMIFAERNKAWLAACSWPLMMRFADFASRHAQSPREAQARFTGVLELTRCYATQAAELITHLVEHCSGTPEKAAVTRDVMICIERFGGTGVKSCRQMNCGLQQTQDVAKLINLISRVDGGPMALLLAGFVSHCPKEHRDRSVQALLGISEAYFAERKQMLHALSRTGRAQTWLTWLGELATKLQRTGPGAADIAAVAAFYGATLQGQCLRFIGGQASRDICIDDVAALLPSHAFFSELRLPLFWMSHWVVRHNEAVITLDQGAVLLTLLKAPGNLGDRIALGLALRDVPADRALTTLENAIRVLRRLGAAPGMVTEAAAQELMKAAPPGFETTAMALMRAFAPLLRQQGIHPHLAGVLSLSRYTHPAVKDLYLLAQLSTAREQPQIDLVAHWVAQFYLTFHSVGAGAKLLGSVMAACRPYLEQCVPDVTVVRSIPNLLQAATRCGDETARFLTRAHAFKVPEAYLWPVFETLARTPANGVGARFLLARLQTDDALTTMAQLASLADMQTFVQQVRAEIAGMRADSENVHNSARITSTEAALAWLKRRAPAGGVNTAEALRAMHAFVETLAQSDPGGAWNSRRTASSRSRLGNARYVLNGPYTQGRDLSPSVAQSPALLDVCALIWYAIDTYRHPRGGDEATMREQKQMREDMFLGMAECVRDEDGFRVCPVGVKQRLISILQGDDRYPEVSVDAVNAAQLLTSLTQDFAKQLGDRDPAADDVEKFRKDATDVAKRRFSRDDKQLKDFERDLASYIAMTWETSEKNLVETAV